MPAERLVDALLTLEHASLEDHLRITFELLDTRNDGTIARENLDEILRVSIFTGAPANEGIISCFLALAPGGSISRENLDETLWMRSIGRHTDPCCQNAECQCQRQYLRISFELLDTP